MYPVGTGDFAQIVDLLRTKESFLMLLHVQPDGDSIGSTLALGLALEQAGKRVTMVRVDELPAVYRFLPGSEKFVPWQEVSGEYDAVIFMDCGDLERTGEAAVLVRLAKVKVNIDHHVTNNLYGDLNYIDPARAAVGEQVYLLMKELGLPLNKEIATALYTSIVTDTGNFRYENTSPDTHLIAAHLLVEDVEPYEVSKAIYETRSMASLQLLAHALNSLERSDDGQIAWVTVTRAVFDQFQAKPEDTEDLISYPRSLQGVEVAICFREVQDDQVKVSFRSKKWCDVSRLAMRFGGGGHARAAGCTFRGSLQAAKDAVLAAAREALEAAPV